MLGVGSALADGGVNIGGSITDEGVRSASDDEGVALVASPDGGIVV